MVTYFHVRISVAGERRDETKVDLDEETLERQFLEPYRSARPITLNGKTITPADISRIRISASSDPSSTIISLLRYEDQNSSVISLGGPGYAWRAAAKAVDVTDQYITGPPGGGAESLSAASTAPSSTSVATSDEAGGVVERGPTDTVFIVAGRDNPAISAVVAFLRALGLQIVEWEHAVAKTGLPNPYVGDAVNAGLRMAGAAVVIITPDDLVRLRDDLIREDDGPDERELRGQARPNVYYEAGIADTLGRERTVIVEVGSVKSFSDAAGRHVVRYDGSAAKRHTFAQRLGVAGLTINTSGQDWLTAGDLAEAISNARQGKNDVKTFQAASAVIDKAELRDQIDAVFELYRNLASKSQHSDFSDLRNESLEFVMRAQAIIDRMPSDSTYALETTAVRSEGAHVRIPVLYAVLRSLHAESSE